MPLPGPVPWGIRHGHSIRIASSLVAQNRRLPLVSASVLVLELLLVVVLELLLVLLLLIRK